MTENDLEDLRFDAQIRHKKQIRQDILNEYPEGVNAFLDFVSHEDFLNNKNGMADIGFLMQQWAIDNGAGSFNLISRATMRLCESAAEWQAEQQAKAEYPDDFLTRAEREARETFYEN